MARGRRWKSPALHSINDLTPDLADGVEHGVDVLTRAAVVDDAGPERKAAAQLGTGKKRLATQLEAIGHRAIDGRDRPFGLVAPSRHAKAHDAQSRRRRDLEVRRRADAVRQV